MGGVLYTAITRMDSVSLQEGEHGFWISFGILLAIFAVVELVLHPTVRLILIPIRFITFGLASLLLSVGLVYGVVLLYPPFTVSSVWVIFLLGGIFAVLQKILR